MNIRFQTTEEFWLTFHNSLSSPISFWREFKSSSLADWISTCKRSPFHDYLNIIFENTPLIKGEYPVVWANGTGMILTNYRLFVNLESGLTIIPLKSVITYEEKNDKLQIEYLLDETLQRLIVDTWLLPDYIQRTIRANEWSILKQEEIDHLKHGYFELERLYSIQAPKVNFSPNIDGLDLSIESSSNKYNKSLVSVENGNIFEQYTFWLKNHPQWLLIILNGYLAYWSYFGVCCCLFQLDGYEIRNEGISYFLDSDNLLTIVILIIPFLLATLLALSIFYKMLTNKRTLNGESPYGFWSIFALISFIMVSRQLLFSFGFLF